MNETVFLYRSASAKCNEHTRPSSSVYQLHSSFHNRKRSFEIDSDPLLEIRQKCEKHFQRLQRYKKAKSFCVLYIDNSEESGSTLIHNSPEATFSSMEFRGPFASSVGDDSLIVDNSDDRLMISGGNIVTFLSNSEGTQNTSPFDIAQQKPQQTSSGYSQEHFEQLRQTMISLMEDDIELLKRLVNLNETLRELRKKIDDDKFAKDLYEASKGKEMNKESIKDLEKDDEEMEEEEQEWRDEFRPLPNDISEQKGLFPEVTRLYVDGNSNWKRDEDGDTEDDGDWDLNPKKQYFSRKNSILRIPIPPRASNRMLGKKIRNSSIKSSDLIWRHESTSYIRDSPLKHEDSKNLQQTQKANASMSFKDVRTAIDSGHSSADSESPPQQHSPSMCTQQQHKARKSVSDPKTSLPSSRYSTFSSAASSIDFILKTPTSKPTDLIARSEQHVDDQINKISQMKEPDFELVETENDQSEEIRI